MYQCSILYYPYHLACVCVLFLNSRSSGLKYQINNIDDTESDPPEKSRETRRLFRRFYFTRTGDVITLCLCCVNTCYYIVYLTVKANC